MVSSFTVVIQAGERLGIVSGSMGLRALVLMPVERWLVRRASKPTGRTTISNPMHAAPRESRPPRTSPSAGTLLQTPSTTTLDGLIFRGNVATMHELALMRSVVEAVSEQLGDCCIVTVWPEVGRLTCVTPDALRFRFEVCARATALEGSTRGIVERAGGLDVDDVIRWESSRMLRKSVHAVP